MRTLDRAIYAIFLLALLADVACAQGSMPVGLDASSGLILDAAAHVQAGPAIESIRTIQSGSVVRGLSHGILGVYRSCCVAQTGAQRNEVDRTYFAAGVSVARIPIEDSGASGIPLFHPDLPAVAVVEHTGSPAP